MAKIVQLVGRRSIRSAVVPLGVRPEALDDFANGDVLGVAGKLLTGGDPLRDEAVVLGLGVWMVQAAEVNATSLNLDEPLAAGMAPQFRSAFFGFVFHGAASKSRFGQICPDADLGYGRSAVSAGIPNFGIQRYLRQTPRLGLEPKT